MSSHFYSVYGPSIKDFLALKRSLGFKYKAGEYELGKLDKIALQKEEVTIGITKKLLDVICSKQPNESGKSRSNRIQIVIQFALFLNEAGYPSCVPPLPTFKSSHTPYIFTHEEILRFFSVCDQIKVPLRNRRGVVFFLPFLFRLLYTTGIRISEAMTLSLNDVDVKNKHLKLRDSKNGKERLIPLSESTSLALKDYLKYRNQRPVRNGVDHLFVDPEGKVPAYGIAYRWFRKILFRTGISHGGRGAGPRLHDLRHTFSVHSLQAMAEKGVDLYYSLPILSTYLGHQSLASTDKYVRLTQEMYPSLIERVNKICPYIFPETNKTKCYEAD
jgi:integrase